MARIRAQVVLPRKTNLPADVVTNTWHFSTSTLPLDEAAKTAIVGGLTAFYNEIDGFMSSVLSPAASIKLYDLDDPEPRVPRWTSTMALSIPSGSAYPEEAAIVLSYRAALLSGTVAARRRGRVFLGPWATSAGTTDSTAGRVFVNATVRAAILTGAANLLTAHGPEDPYKWSVYSPTTDEMHVVTGGWCDSAFDTVRSRGGAAVDRLTFGV